MRPYERSGFAEPLSAQAHAPNRPSGADKKKVQDEGSGRPGLIGPPSDRAIIAADRHFCPRHRVPKVAEIGKWNVTAERTGARFLADSTSRTQGSNYVSKHDVFRLRCPGSFRSD